MKFRNKLTNTVFHSNNKTFFIGKCGAWPLQNFVTIPKSITAKGSWLHSADPVLNVIVIEVINNFELAVVKYIKAKAEILKRSSQYTKLETPCQYISKIIAEINC